MKEVSIIGAGLAGCEAAYQVSKRGIHVNLFEMKPNEKSDAHHSNDLCELVCSNSLKSNAIDNACGLLKEEMRKIGSLVMSCADKTKVPAGAALAVDRDEFARCVSEKIRNDANITLISKTVSKIEENVPTIIATGPLTHPVLIEEIKRILGDKYLYFFDAAAPIVETESIDFDLVYRAARYGKGEADYINCPMNKEEYLAFYDALINAKTAPIHHDIDKVEVFEGCMPIEVMAKRGVDTLRYGPLKPKGLPDPKTGKEPYAVIQLRQDNTDASMYNIVGFQTNLKFSEQKRVFSMIPGLKNANFLRYGVMHRNTYINSPGLLNEDYSLISDKNIFFAGQITGVEGYVESCASGMCAGINIARNLLGEKSIVFPATTVLGALSFYISKGSASHFQPMNANFGIVEPLNERIKNKKDRYMAIAERSLKEIDNLKSLI